jgi:hypothetical protein
MVLIWIYVIVVSDLQRGGDPLFYVRMSRSRVVYPQRVSFRNRGLFFAVGTIVANFFDDA